jgi:hypothetical protein
MPLISGVISRQQLLLLWCPAVFKFLEKHFTKGLKITLECEVDAGALLAL